MNQEEVHKFVKNDSQGVQVWFKYRKLLTRSSQWFKDTFTYLKLIIKYLQGVQVIQRSKITYVEITRFQKDITTQMLIKGISQDIYRLIRNDLQGFTRLYRSQTTERVFTRDQ